MSSQTELSIACPPDNDCPILNSVCKPTLNRCVCAEGYAAIFHNESNSMPECIPSVELHPTILAKSISPTTIIIIVLGVMFIGICVVLHLFSRARFTRSRSGSTGSVLTNNRASMRRGMASNNSARRIASASANENNVHVNTITVSTVS